MPVNQTYISFITTGFDREVILNNTINFKSGFQLSFLIRDFFNEAMI